MVSIPRILKSLLCIWRPSHRSPVDTRAPIATPGPKTIQSELKRLSIAIENAKERVAFQKDAEYFLLVYARYLSMLYVSGHEKIRQLDWPSIWLPSKISTASHRDLPAKYNAEHLQKLAVLKTCVQTRRDKVVGLNPRTTIQKDVSFVDLAVQDILHLRLGHGAAVPCFFLTPPESEQGIVESTQRYAHQPVELSVIPHSKFPVLLEDTLLPLPNGHKNRDEWYSPGTGDVFSSLARSGHLDKLLADGKEYLFVSDLYNPGAAVDPRILDYVIQEHVDFLTEVVERSDGEAYESTLVDYQGHPKVLHASQVPEEYLHDLSSFPHITTGSFWINLVELKKALDCGPLELDVISHTNTVENGKNVVRLETDISAAMVHFRDAQALSVPRTRYCVVRNVADMALLKSDRFVLRDGALLPTTCATVSSHPIIKLKDMHEITDLDRCMPHPLSMVDLESLAVLGDVRFGTDVTLRGKVVVHAKDGSKLQVPDGSVLQDCLLSGNFIIEDV